MGHVVVTDLGIKIIRIVICNIAFYIVLLNMFFVLMIPYSQLQKLSVVATRDWFKRLGRAGV